MQLFLKLLVLLLLSYPPLSLAAQTSKTATTISQKKQSANKQKTTKSKPKTATKSKTKTKKAQKDDSSTAKRPTIRQTAAAKKAHLKTASARTTLQTSTKGKRTIVHKQTLAASKKFARSPQNRLASSRFHHVKKAAISTLMKQLGKPYRWGGSSPQTGFDCSGLVHYAYSSLLSIKLPRTANEMFQLKEAPSVRKEQLDLGDLVFFRIHNRGSADHVGVYVGEGKFIQSPRTGRDIQISKLSDDYWNNHYVGARRVITANTVR